MQQQRTQDGAFYFGCWDDTGHYLWNRHKWQAYGYRLPADFPVSEHLDAKFLPPFLPEVEGRATLLHINGWTIMSFWDRSVDPRGKCNSTFLFRGTHDFEKTVELAKTVFPSIWGRFRFEVVEYKPEKVVLA